MVLSEVAVDIVAVEDEARFRDLMQAHHYLGAVPGMGETVRYVAHHRGRWLALAVFSAPALKCGARDRWIGWDYGVQFGRLHLVTNNARFLILPGGERNLGLRVLSLCARRLVRDWPARFGHDLLLAETRHGAGGSRAPAVFRRRRKHREDSAEPAPAHPSSGRHQRDRRPGAPRSLLRKPKSGYKKISSPIRASAEGHGSGPRPQGVPPYKCSS